MPKLSERVLKMHKDPQSVWGKNLELEKFWGGLASGKYVVLIYKDGTHEYIILPKRTTKKFQTMFAGFEEDINIVSVLSSNLSQNAYEQSLYPKAKDKTVVYVIKNILNRLLLVKN
jgi:hypothetical protein